MKFSHAALLLMGYRLRSNTWNDFVSNTMQTWFKFSPDHSVSNFVMRTNPNHRNVMDTTHGGTLMTFMDYSMAGAVWDYTNGKNSFTIEMHNRFIRPARLDRWLFSEIKIVDVSETISLEGRITANGPDGMLIMQSNGVFSLPKDSKPIDTTT